MGGMSSQVYGGGPCDYCVSPSPKNWILGQGQDLGPVGTGDWDFDLGLTKSLWWVVVVVGGNQK